MDLYENRNRKDKTEIEPFTELLVSVRTGTGTEIRFGFIPWF